MAHVNVGTAPVALPVKAGQRPVIQNLGPGDVYLDTHSGVTVADGFYLEVGAAYEWPADVQKDLFAVASQASDVRVVVVG